MRSYSPPDRRRLVRRIVSEIRAALAAGRPVYVTLETGPWHIPIVRADSAAEARESLERGTERARIRVASVTHHRTGATSWTSEHGTYFPALAWGVAVVEWAE